MKVIIICIFLASLFLFSCVPTKVEKKELPIGNLNREQPDDSINTSANNIAPISVPKGLGASAAAFDREIINTDLQSGRKIISSSRFIGSLLEGKEYSHDEASDTANVIKELTKNLENVSLTTDSTGFVSFSQPWTSRYANFKDIAVTGNVGGTDIFHMSKNERGEFIFKALPEPVNSLFWDSHPFAVRDTIRNRAITLLVWASDRETPYIRDAIDGVQEHLDINLYYAFLDDKGRVLSHNRFQLSNSKADEISPFIYCVCCNNTKLLFATNRSGENDFKKKNSKFGERVFDRNDFDIFYTDIEIDFANLTITEKSIPKYVSQVYQEKGDIPSINSYFNEVFPFVPNPIPKGDGGNYLYFSSDRFKTPWSQMTQRFLDTPKERECPCEASSADSLLVSVGGFDFYRFAMPANFRCEPPPPPKLFITAKVRTIELSPDNDTLSIKELREQSIEIRKLPQDLYEEYSKLVNSRAIISDSLQKLDTKTKAERELWKKLNDELSEADKKLESLKIKASPYLAYSEPASDVVYEAETKSVYMFNMLAKGNDCLMKSCSDVILRTPNEIYKNDTITVEILCITKPRKPELIDFTYNKGLSFFVTGYWHPTTNENLFQLHKRIADNCLEKSLFIDIDDYDYRSAAQLNTDFLQKEFYPKLDSVLKKLDKCYPAQTLRITVYGMTDPCRLRPTENDEWTRYSCDPEINYNGYVIKPGTKMKTPSFVDASGKPMPLPQGPQQGNWVLAMLRAYYTMETIDKGLKEYSAIYKTLRENKPAESIFDLRAVGIDRINTLCPTVWNNFVKDERFKNEPLIPETCNKPYSRRVMLYVDIVTHEDLSNGFECSPCGIRENKTRIKQEPIITDIPQLPIDFITNDTIWDLERKDPKDPGCPGPPCYFWIEFAVVETEEQAQFIVNVLNQAGITDVVLDKTKPSVIIIATEQEMNKENVERKLEKYQKILESKLKPLVDEIKLKIRVKY